MNAEDKNILMNKRLKIWILFGAIIICGIMALGIEYFLNSFPIFGLVLLIIGVIGWLIAEIELEMNQ
jgi:drug/metabolite transporter (DMT)-like permease